jgi:hypothetical protein
MTDGISSTGRAAIIRFIGYDACLREGGIQHAAKMRPRVGYL